MTDELIGKKFGGYEILDIIGRGGMATVYRAQQSSMSRLVALKVLPRQFINDEAYIMRFNREVKIIAQLEHRNIVPVHDYGEQDGQPYIVMRYMAGGSIDDQLTSGALPLDAVVKLIEQIAPALDYAHSKNVLHRDMKPSNILLDDNGGAYLTDFGIARIMGDPTVSTATQGVIGTPSYMSPEQAQGQKLDSRSDIYSLGVMIFEMTTGRRPFESDTPYGVAVKQVTEPAPRPSTLNANVPPAVEDVILTAMRKRADERYPNGAALTEALRQAVENGFQRRPNPLHDTQPGILRHPADSAPSVRLYDVTPQTPPPPQSLSQQPLPPPNDFVRQPVSSHTPYPPQTNASSAINPEMRGRKRRAKGGNVMFSAVLGILIGCGLLAAVIAAGLYLMGETNREEAIIRNQTATVEALETRNASETDQTGAGTDDSASTLEITATPYPTSTTPPTTEPSLTPSFTPAIPAGTATFAPIGERPNVSDLRGAVVFFADRETLPTPSGDETAEAHPQSDFNLYSIDLATHQETQLTDTAAAELYPAVSPDGSMIAFTADRDGDFDLYLMDAASLAVRRLSNNDVLDRAPSWSADSAWLVFSSDTNDNGGGSLYRISVEGGEPELLYHSDRRAADPVYTISGRYLLFTEGDARDASTWEIMRLEVESGEVTQLTDNAHKDWHPILAPNGSITYLTSHLEGEPALGYAAIASMSMTGENITRLYDGEGYESSLAYSADGTILFFASDVSGRDEVYALTDTTSAPEQVTESGGLHPMWVTR